MSHPRGFIRAASLNSNTLKYTQNIERRLQFFCDHSCVFVYIYLWNPKHNNKEILQDILALESPLIDRKIIQSNVGNTDIVFTHDSVYIYLSLLSKSLLYSIPVQFLCILH